MAETKSPPESAPPSVPATAPLQKARRIPRKIVEATEVFLEGRARNLAQAAEIVGCSRQYLSQQFLRRPDAVQYVQRRAAHVLGITTAVAAARMASLIHAESEHVSFRASEHVLGVSGIKPARDADVSVSVTVRSGYLIDLRNDDRGKPLPTIEEGVAGATIVDTPIDDGKVIESAGKALD